MQNKFLIVINIIILAVILFFVSCKSFSHIWVDELPPECNMALNSYKVYYESKDKSGVVQPLTYCFKKLHREYCKKEVFGNGKIIYKGELYRNYTQCMSELK